MRGTRIFARTSAFVAAAVVAVSLADGVAIAGDGKRAIDVIENDLVSDDAAVRAKAAAELMNRFPDGTVAVPMLVDLLEDESPDVVAAAAKAIDSMAVAGATPLTSYFLDDAHWKSGSRAAESLPVLLTLKAPSPADGLDWERIVKAMTPLVTAEDAAIVALVPRYEGRSSGWNVSTPLLLAAARQGNGETRSLAAAALAMAGADAVLAKGLPATAAASRAAPATAAIGLVKSKSDVRSWTGSRVLARLRSGDATCIAALTEALTAPKDPPPKREKWEPRACRAACDALGAAGTAAVAVAPTLLRIAADEKAEFSFTYDCVDALLQMGKESDLAGLVTAKGPTAGRIAGALATRKRAAAVVVPYLLEELAKSESAYMASDIALYGTAASEALPALQQRIRKSNDKGEFVDCADAILAIAPADRPCINAVRKLVSDEDERTAERALRTIVRRATAASDFAPELQAALVRATAGTLGMEIDPSNILDALARCGPSAKSAAPDVVKAIQAADKTRVDYRSGPRATLTFRSGVLALGAIGPDAAASVPALEALRGKADETVRVPLAQALRRIKAKK